MSDSLRVDGATIVTTDFPLPTPTCNIYSPCVPISLSVAAYSKASLNLYLPGELRDIERAAAARLPPHTLMARAGATVAHWLYGRLPALASDSKQPVLVLAGPSNNGGKAYVAAQELHRRRVLVDVWQLAPPTTDDARWALAEALTIGVPVRTVPSMWPELLAYSWIVDGLFGIELSRALEGPAAMLVRNIAYAHEQGTPVLSIDIPSGLMSATGIAAGPLIHADVTIAMLGACPGLLMGLGHDVAGDVLVAKLGAEDALALHDGGALSTGGPSAFIADLPQRRHASHKGSYGSLAILGGQHGMAGAPILSARTGLMMGVGRGYVGFVSHDAPAWDPVHPELMLGLAEDLDLTKMQAVCIGPGLGTSVASAACLSHALTLEHAPLVIDADALNLLAEEPSLAGRVRRRAGPTVLTPHPLEAARLAGCDVACIQSNRLASARALAQDFGATVVLKGSGTIVDNSVHAWINTTGNSGLATAGTGDVLTGAIGALLAQGMPTLQAALAAVWLHGKAAERCVEDGVGPAGLTASELIPTIRTELRALTPAIADRSCISE